MVAHLNLPTHNKPHPSNHAGWLWCRLSLRCHLVLSSSSQCATLSSSNRAGWLLRRLSLRRRLVLSSRRTLVLSLRRPLVVSSHRLVVAFLGNYFLKKGLEEDLLSMPNFTERRDKDRAFVPPALLAAPATMAVVVPHRPGRRTLSLGWALP